MNNTPTRTDTPATTEIISNSIQPTEPATDAPRVEDLAPAASADIAGGGPGLVLQHNESTSSDDDGATVADPQEMQDKQDKPQAAAALDQIPAQDLAPARADAIAGGGLKLNHSESMAGE